MEIRDDDDIDMEINPEFEYITESQLLSFKTTNGESVSITDVRTDVESKEEKRWKYKNMMKVIVNYNIQGKKDTHNVRLDNLLKRKRYPQCTNTNWKDMEARKNGK